MIFSFLTRTRVGQKNSGETLEEEHTYRTWQFSFANIVFSVSMVHSIKSNQISMSEAQRIDHGKIYFPFYRGNI